MRTTIISDKYGNSRKISNNEDSAGPFRDMSENKKKVSYVCGGSDFVMSAIINKRPTNEPIKEPIKEPTNISDLDRKKQIIYGKKVP